MSQSSKTDTPANKKSLTWLLVINDKKEAQIAEIEPHLRLLMPLLIQYTGFHYVFTIIHNKDTQKRTHLHAFIELYEKATKKSLLDTLTTLLNVDREQLSLEPSNSDILGVQYLTHKNQTDKEPYSYEEIQTNNQEELANRYGKSYSNPEEERKKILFRSKTMSQLLEQLNIEEAKKVLPVWKEIKAEQGYNKEGLIAQLEKMRNDYCLLYDLTNKVFEILELELYKDNKKAFETRFGGLKGVFDELLPF